MRVTSYGLFWREAEIDWHPGQGSKDSFHLLGRLGANSGHVKVADFRMQQGIYILYDDYGPTYVGLTRDQGLGKRLKDHQFDHLAGKWDRFSWFGFRPVTKQKDGRGRLMLGNLDGDLKDDSWTTIGDLEALLIRAIGPRRNRKIMRFAHANEWIQIDYDDVEKYSERAKR